MPVIILLGLSCLTAKPIPTLMVVSQHLSTDGPLLFDPILYRSSVSAL